MAAGPRGCGAHDDDRRRRSRRRTRRSRRANPRHARLRFDAPRAIDDRRARPARRGARRCGEPGGHRTHDPPGRARRSADRDEGTRSSGRDGRDGRGPVLRNGVSARRGMESPAGADRRPLDDDSRRLGHGSVRPDARSAAARQRRGGAGRDRSRHERAHRHGSRDGRRRRGADDHPEAAERLRALGYVAVPPVRLLAELANPAG